MIKNQKIGLFGGSFDPIHFGHLNLALQIKRLAHLDKVLFCPAAVSPFKADNPPKVTATQRLRMCELALEDVPGCEVLDLEVKRGGVSYMIDTVNALSFPVHLILAADSLPTLHLWKDADKLIKLAPPLIGSRHSISGSYDGDHFDVEGRQLIEKGRFKTQVMEISSTDIREMLGEGGHFLGHLMPRKVIDYIQKHQLYSRSKHEKRSTRAVESGLANHL